MRFLLPLFLCLFTISAQATIHTVSNDPNNPAQFDNLQDAHNAAAAGDTIYITPSPVGGYSISMNRRLTIIGQGYVPSTNGQFTYTTYIGEIVLAPTNTSKVDGSKFIGLSFGSMHTSNSFSATDADNIIIERCRGAISAYANGGHLSNFKIKHSFIDISVASSSNGTNFSGTITNSFIMSLSIPYSLGTIFKNCVFATGQYFNVNNCTIENSIFIEAQIVANNIKNTNFTNNTFSTYGDNIPLGESNNGGSGNLFNTDPQFVIYDIASGSGGNSSGGEGNRDRFHDTEDYHLKDTSPGKFYGTDGTDIGMYGGVDPFPAGPYTGAPPIPVVTLFNLLNGIVGPNGQLNYEVEATTQN